ncbi:MAG TPA: EamA family transporter [Methylomirabilota bacterium]|nr:EamA family transporter [Methylomirabilota bacterium]
MTTAALLLVLAAALIHAAWNALTKRAGDPVAFLWCIGAVATVLYLPGAVYVLQAKGFTRPAVPFVVATVVLHAIYFFALGRAYRLGDLSLVYPVARGTGVALVPGLAWFVLDERLSPLGAAGVVLVVLGIVSLHWRPGFGHARLFAPGTGWAFATGLAIAGYSLVDKAGVAHVHPLAYIWLMEAGSCVVLLAALLPRREAIRREWRTNWRAIVLGGVMSPGAYLLVLFAFQLSKASYVVAGREVSIVFSTLIGGLWMREGALIRRLAGAAVVAAGVVCVALAR